MNCFAIFLFFYFVDVGASTYEIHQDYKCRVNRLIGVNEKYDSHVTFLLTQDCYLFLKLDWQMKYFLKRGLDSTKVKNNNCLQHTEKHILFTNIDKENLYIIRFYKASNVTVEGVVNRINYIKALRKGSSEGIKIKYSATDEQERNDYIETWPISINISPQIYHFCIVVDNEEVKLKCLNQWSNNSFYVSTYGLKSDKIFKLEEQSKMYGMEYDADSSYGLFFNNDDLYAYKSDEKNGDFIPVFITDKTKMNESEYDVQKFIMHPPLKGHIAKYIITTINNAGLILNLCIPKADKKSDKCKAHFIEEGYNSRKSACLYNYEFSKNTYFISGVIPLKNHERTPTTVFRKDECIKEFEKLIEDAKNDTHTTN
uniref:6-cysteine protein n=1 Tax=Strongyloides papillosus TaxID=174720 RepID=A0A0N5B8W8_STREA